VIQVLYAFQFDTVGQSGEPRLQVRVNHPDHPELGADIDGCLDSGAERSLFDGALVAAATGIDLMQGEALRYRSTIGPAAQARVHRLDICHPQLGRFPLDVGLSMDPIGRNLLGRDFFNLVQVGFREHHSVFYVTARP